MKTLGEKRYSSTC